MKGLVVEEGDKWVLTARVWILVSIALIIVGVATGRPMPVSRISIMSDAAVALTSSLVMLAMLIWAHDIRRRPRLGAPVGAIRQPESYRYALTLFMHAMFIGIISVIADFLDSVYKEGLSWLLYIPDELSPPIFVLMLFRVVYLVFYEVSDIGSPLFFRRITIPVTVITGAIVAMGFLGVVVGFYGFTVSIDSFGKAMNIVAGFLGLAVAFYSANTLRRLRLRFFMADYIDLTLSILVFYAGFNVLDMLGSFLVFGSPIAGIVYHAIKFILVIGGIFYALVIASAAIDLFTAARVVIAESYEKQRSVVFEINTGDITRAYSVIASYIRRLAARRGIDTVLIFGWRPPRLYHALRMVLPSVTEVRFCSIVPGVAFPETREERCIVGPEASHILHLYLEEKTRAPSSDDGGGGEPPPRRIMIVIDGVSESLILAGLPKTIDLLGKILYNLKEGDIVAIIYDRGAVEAEKIPPIRAMADTLVEVT